FLVRLAACNEIGNLPLGRCQFARRSGPATDATQLRARLRRPELRTALLEDGQPRLERLTCQATLLDPPLQRAERKQRARPIAGCGQNVVLPQGAVERDERAVKVVARGAQKASTAQRRGSGCRRVHRSCPFLELGEQLGRFVQFADGDKRFDRVWFQFAERV